MKIWIDKHGGMHYHKADCKAIQPSENPPHFKYEGIEHKVRRLGMPYHKEYGEITIEGRRYRPCPFCFGHSRRRIAYITKNSPPLRKQTGIPHQGKDELIVADEANLVPAITPCPECQGKTILFRGKDLDTQYYLCSHWKEAGHLTEDEIKKKYQGVFKPIWKRHGGREA